MMLWNIVLRSRAACGLGCLAALLAGCSRPVPSVAEGRSLYRANGCASCHGQSGRGDGPIAAALPATPIDLRNPSLFKRGACESAIAATLAEGVPNAGGSALSPGHSHHELLMPRFDHLTDPERRSIALYVISLQHDADQRPSP